MKSLNLTEAELAERLGTSQSAVSNALTGQTRFDVFRTEKYCDALECPVEEFLHEYETTGPDAAGPLANDEPAPTTQHDAPGADERDDYTDPVERQRAEELGRILRRLRERAGPDGGLLTQQTLACAIGGQQPAITKAEHAMRPINIAELEEIAWRLGSTLTAVYRELQHDAPRPSAPPAQSEPDE